MGAQCARMSAAIRRGRKAADNATPIEIPDWETHKPPPVDAATQTEIRPRANSVPKEAFRKLGASLIKASEDAARASKDDWEVVQTAQSV